MLSGSSAMPRHGELSTQTAAVVARLQIEGLERSAASLRELLRMPWTSWSEAAGEIGQELMAVRDLEAGGASDGLLELIEGAITTARDVWPELRPRSIPSQCAGCVGVRASQAIRVPSDLRRVAGVVCHEVETGALIRVPGPGGMEGKSLADVAAGPEWPDVIDHRFQCAACKGYFALTVETYRGCGGHWRAL